MAVVDCKQLTKIYKSLWTTRSQHVCALRNVSLSIKAGEIIGLIGPNGAGKTTLLSLIAGLIYPTKGCVTICGQHPRSMEARRALGYMPELPTFLGRYSARAVLKYHGALYGLRRRDINEKVDQLLENLELTAAADRACRGFSQGMRQRLALAVALMNNPKVLLLDEPSNGLDPIGIIKLRELLKQLSNSGTAVLISSHRLGELEKLTSNYVLLYRGKVAHFDNRIASSKSGGLRIEYFASSDGIAKEILAKYEVVDVSDTQLVITVDSEEQIPEIVNNLVRNGIRIKSVCLQKEDIEDVFIRMYNEKA